MRLVGAGSRDAPFLLLWNLNAPQSFLPALENDLLGPDTRVQHELQGNARISAAWTLGLVGHV